MTTYTYERVLEDILTVEDVHLVASEIDTLLVHLYKADQNIFATALNTTLHRNLADVLSLSMQEQHVTLDNHTEVQHFFSGLKTFIAQLPILQLTLAYHPTNEQVIKLTEWVRQQTGKPVILHINYNKEMLGGAIITFEGRYTDLSLKKKLDGMYLTKREDILNRLQ